jgi:hypothetical protein
MKLVFTPEDFPSKHDYPIPSDVAAYIADLSNTKLQKLIESWPVVYKVPSSKYIAEMWQDHRKDGHQARYTHKARLAFLEKIPKEPCTHEPDTLFGLSKRMMAGPRDEVENTIVCKHCGIELVSEWRAK